MTLHDLIEHAYLSSDSGWLTRKEIRAVLTDVLTNISKMPVGDSLRIAHFGTFRKVVQKARLVHVLSPPPGSRADYNLSLFKPHVVQTKALEVLKFRAATGYGKKKAAKK